MLFRNIMIPISIEFQQQQTFIRGMQRDHCQYGKNSAVNVITQMGSHNIWWNHSSVTEVDVSGDSVLDVGSVLIRKKPWSKRTFTR